MLVSNKHFFISDEKLANSKEFVQIFQEIDEAIASIVWHAPDKFIINPTRKGNGVVPIKGSFVKYLVGKGWNDEHRLAFANGMNPGPIDVVKETSHGLFAVEWETGNISSSHRALNKIAIGIKQGKIIGGLLILPTKDFAKYLTDRVGNYEEIEPYFEIFGHRLESGILGAYSIMHDDVSIEARLIPKGQDGNAKKKKKSKKVVKRKAPAKKTVAPKKSKKKS